MNYKTEYELINLLKKISSTQEKIFDELKNINSHYENLERSKKNERTFK